MTKLVSNRLLLITLRIICLVVGALSTAAPEPSPVSIPVRTNWFGYDGNWSPVSIRVGTPPQWVDLFVSTASQETWVVGNGGCDGTTECLTKRGGVFQSNESSTWADQEPFVLGLDPHLGFSGDAIYGFDNISLSNDISVPSQVIGVINTTEYWLGFFGLGIAPTNFTSVDKPTFLDSMVESMSLIPSHSYGYTAGAYYRLKSVPASLVLGGFDANRFEPHDITFDLDPGQNPVVAFNEITVTAQPLRSSKIRPEWSGNSLILLGSDEGNLFTIDSSTPYLWLPEAVCLEFERAFGLTYDDAIGLYTFGSNSTQHQMLVDWNMTFQFTIADLPGSSNSVSLSLPYEAFDLQLSYPYPGLNATQSSPPTNYFPLRKAANNTQYTIGRTFLQETYLKVDYERNNFSIFQATFSPNALADTDLISITRPKNSTFSGPEYAPTKPVLSKAGIAGVAVGSAIALVSLICLIALCIRFRRGNATHGYVKEQEGEDQRKKKTSNSRFLRWLFRLPKPETPTEIGGSDRYAFEAPTGRECMELPAKTSESELDGSETETPAYTEADCKGAGKAINAIGHDPDKPVELPYRSSARGYYEPETAPKILSDSAPAPYKLIRDLHGLSRQNTQTTVGISSPSKTSSNRSSKDVSPTFVVSPITPRDPSHGFSSLSTIARRGPWYESRESRGGQRVRRGTLVGSDDGKAGDTKSSNGSSATKNIPRSAPRIFSWRADASPERRVMGNHTPTDSTVHALP